jgi:hypothetical protein
MQTTNNTNNIQYKQQTIQTTYNTNNIQYKQYQQYKQQTIQTTYNTNNTNNKQYKQHTITDNDLRTFILLFYVVLFVVLY